MSKAIENHLRDEFKKGQAQKAAFLEKERLHFEPLAQALDKGQIVDKSQLDINNDVLEYIAQTNKKTYILYNDYRLMSLIDESDIERYKRAKLMLYLSKCFFWSGYIFTKQTCLKRG